jgi:methyl-accepting chemotaxis protein
MASLGKLKISARLGLGFGLLVLLLIGMAGMAARQTAVIHDALEYYTVNTTPSLATFRAALVAIAIADGDLSIEVRTRAGDTHSLLAAVRTMRERLAGVVAQVRNGSDSIAIGSAQIAWRRW